ncbi:hypothetical protein ASG89_21945 [Paenibacillus sp. Soil766]|nr:hypothetical protein ASG89_21945 [Paenibacillus sp. Soil766]
MDSKDMEEKRNSNRHKSHEDVICVEGGMPTIISKEDFLKVQGKKQQPTALPTIIKKTTQ